MDPKQETITYLRSKYQKEVITPKQLQNEFPMTIKQQSVLRQEGRFPFKYIKIGKNVFYNIYAVADFLIDGEQQLENSNLEKEMPAEQEVKQVKVKTRKADERIEDLSHLFNMRGFVANLVSQQDNITNLINYFTTRINYEELKAELSTTEKETKTTRIDKV
ncbi:MAG: hypothetical protein PHW29_04515 [Flavobacterium sp.]|nr:hypothetical protein [Flavobacterium sp.]